MRRIVSFIIVAFAIATSAQHMLRPALTAATSAAAAIAPVASSASAVPTTPAALQVLPDSGEATAAGSCHVDGLLPDAACSPGALTAATKANICTRGWAGHHRHVTESVKRAVYAEYGITKHSGATYEMDHIVSLELGGSNNVRNLYPESAPSFHEKDRVENAAHRAVCDGSLDLATAQRMIASDWTRLRYLVK
jgi:hypothetical protein